MPSVRVLGTEGISFAGTPGEFLEFLLHTNDRSIAPEMKPPVEEKWTVTITVSGEAVLSGEGDLVSLVKAIEPELEDVIDDNLPEELGEIVIRLNPFRKPKE